MIAADPDALTLPATDEEREAAWRRVGDALDELRAAAAAVGLDVSELRSPLADRCDAWLHRTRRLLDSDGPYYPRGESW